MLEQTKCHEVQTYSSSAVIIYIHPEMSFFTAFVKFFLSKVE